MKVDGPRTHILNKHHILRRKDGVYLKCATKDGLEFRVPVVKSRGYLGAIISYGNYQNETLQRRLQAAELSFTRIKTVLGCRRVIPLWQRLRVYSVCVTSALQYAIFASGFGPTEVAKTHGVCMRHLRYIAHSPKHITRESNEQLCDRLGRQLPVVELYATWERKCRSWMARRAQLPEQDIQHQTPCYPPFPLTPQVYLLGGLHVADDAEETYSCRFREGRFTSSQARNTHEPRVHKQATKEVKGKAEAFSPSRDAVPGTWQCAHCLVKFQRCLNLSRHITRAACMMMMMMMMMMMVVVVVVVAVVVVVVDWT